MADPLLLYCTNVRLVQQTTANVATLIENNECLDAAPIWYCLKSLYCYRRFVRPLFVLPETTNSLFSISVATFAVVLLNATLHRNFRLFGEKNEYPYNLSNASGNGE